MPNRPDRRARAPRRGDGPRRGRPLHREPVVRVGPLPERARLGHGPRGLLGERRRLGLLPARPRPLARVPLERGRHGRHLGHPPRPLPRARALERERPDPQGAHVRPHRAAGEPRRGRQGVLVVPRRAAEPRAAASGATTTRRRRSRTTQLVHHGRGLHDPELELLDTGVFDGDRYWSVDVTYAKASPTEVLMRIELENHGPDEATLDVLPTLWFRNTWSWDDDGAAAADRGRRLGARRRRPPPRRLPARGRARPGRRARPRRSSARTRRTRRASSAPRRRRRTRRTASTTTSSRARRPSTRRASARRPRSATA